MKGKTVPAPPVHEYKPEEEFVKEYNKLCEKYGYRLSVTPIWKLRDDSSFSMILQYGVEKIPREGS